MEIYIEAPGYAVTKDSAVIINVNCPFATISEDIATGHTFLVTLIDRK